MKIGYFADGPWGHETLELLLSDTSLEIAFIVPRNDTKDMFLKNKAKEFSIDYLCPVKVNTDDFYEQAKKYDCDLFVSMSYNQIFRNRIYSLPRYKTINCHAGKLPFYRGRNILNWALINDEKEFGITVHYVDEGIDTGDIIIQETYPITDADDYGTLLQVAYRECPKLLYEAIKKIQSGDTSCITQKSISEYGFYCGMRTKGDEIIDWNSTSREIFNFVRAICLPGPMALTWCDGEPVNINRVVHKVEFPKYKGINGQVLAKQGNNLVVKTADSYVLVTEYKSKGNIAVGSRLGLYCGGGTELLRLLRQRNIFHDGYDEHKEY